MPELAAIIGVPHFVTWSVACDGDGCSSLVTVGCATDREAIEMALDRAVELGWLIAQDRFIRPREDLCPSCRKVA